MNAKSRSIIAATITVLTVLVMYGVGCRMIFSGVQRYSRDAQASYGGAPVEALIALARDQQAVFEQRNNAIWALGQIGDPRALPVLKQLETGVIQHPPYDPESYIVQYSVKKAIRQINGFTVTRWMYCWLD